MAKRPDHPYTKYEGRPTWRRISNAIADLEKNGDLTITTHRPHVIGYICRSLSPTADARNRLAELRDETRDDDRTWNRILRLIERRRRLVESQRKRLQELDLTVSRAEVLRFATGLLESVTRFVTDATTLKQITDEFRAVVGDIDGTGRVH